MSWLPASHGERRQEHEPRQLQLGKSEAAAAAVSTTDEITTKGRAKRSVNAEKKTYVPHVHASTIELLLYLFLANLFLTDPAAQLRLLLQQTSFCFLYYFFCKTELATKPTVDAIDQRGLKACIFCLQPVFFA